MARDMSPEELRAFLADGARTAKCAVTRRDGRPHVTPVWFVLDGEALVFTTHAESVKGRCLRRTGQVCLCVDNEAPPFDFVTIDGTAAISEDPDELRRWATRIGGRYMGAERAEEYGARNAVEGELLVHVTPTRVTARVGVAD